MKRLTIILVFIIISWSNSIAQIVSEKYILSFPVLSSNDTLLVSEKLTFKKNPMTKREALTFVYNNDSSKLICRGDFYDMINEKKTGEWTKEVLPDKCFMVRVDSSYLLANTYFDCHNRGELWCLLKLVIYDNSFKPIDTLTIYKGDENRIRISSIINIKTNKLFLCEYNFQSKLFEYKIYKIDTKVKKFEVIKLIKVKESLSDDLKQVIKELGIYNLFYR